MAKIWRYNNQWAVEQFFFLCLFSSCRSWKDGIMELTKCFRHSLLLCTYIISLSCSRVAYFVLFSCVVERMSHCHPQPCFGATSCNIMLQPVQVSYRYPYVQTSYQPVQSKSSCWYHPTHDSSVHASFCFVSKNSSIHASFCFTNLIYYVLVSCNT